MKALTVCQPYPSLICLPDSDPRAKRVENRTRRTNHRGTLAIHAGQSRVWLADGDGYGLPLEGMPFGAVVAVAELVGCAEVVDRRPVREGWPCFRRGLDWHQYIRSEDLDQWPWLRGHRHAHGPWLWILDGVRPVPEPVECRGALGLWDLPDAVMAEVLRQLPDLSEAIACR